jgi:transposase
MWIAEPETRSRRQWTVAEKLRIVADSWEPGSSANQVARRYRISPNLVFRWRRLVRNGQLTQESAGTPEPADELVTGIHGPESPDRSI